MINFTTHRGHALFLKLQADQVLDFDWIAGSCQVILLKAGARFSKAPESFRTRKAIFKSSVSKNGEVYTLETSCMK